MSRTVLIPDTNVRKLSDAVLADRLTRDLLEGWRSGNRTALIGGFPIVVNDERNNMADWIDHLTRQKPGTATVVRHDDGTVDVTLSHAVSVHLYQGGSR